MQRRASKIGYREVKEHAAEEEKRELAFTRKFRLFKIFRAWRDEILMRKMQREQEYEQNKEHLLQAEEMSR